MGGMGVDDKAKVKVIDTSVKEPADEEENDEPKAGKESKPEPAGPKSK